MNDEREVSLKKKQRVRAVSGERKQIGGGGDDFLAVIG